MCKVLLILCGLITAVHLAPTTEDNEDMLLYWKGTKEDLCKPFTTFYKDCNKCVCSAEGISYCTKMACFKRDLLNKMKQIQKYLVTKDMNRSENVKYSDENKHF